MNIALIYNGTRCWWYNYRSKLKPKRFKSIEDVFTYIDHYNTKTDCSQSKGRIVDFEVL